jgi:hypothetical protein
MYVQLDIEEISKRCKPLEEHLILMNFGMGNFTTKVIKF